MDRQSPVLTPLQRQLAYQCSRRSMREVEEILLPFVTAQLAMLDETMCNRLLKLLQFTDNDLLEWFLDIEKIPDGVDRDLMRTIRACRS